LLRVSVRVISRTRRWAGLSALVALAVVASENASAASNVPVAKIDMTGQGKGEVYYTLPLNGSRTGRGCTEPCDVEPTWAALELVYGLKTVRLTFTATAASGSRLAAWAGLCASAGTSPSCSITVTAGTTAQVSARFELGAEPKAPAQPKPAAQPTTTNAPRSAKPPTSADKEPATGPPPKWKLVLSESVLFSVRGRYVSGHAEARLVGVTLPPLKKGQKHREFQEGGRFWVLGRHSPRNIHLLYRGQTLRASYSLQTHEAEPAIQYHFYFTPKGAALPVFSVLGRGTGTLVFATDAGSVRMPVTVRIKAYGQP